MNNLNALKTGLHTHPLPPPDLDRLANQVVHHPEEFPLDLGLAVESIHRRTRDPLNRTLGLLRLVQQLLPLVSAELARIELKNLLEKIPPQKHESVLQIIKKRSAYLDTAQQLHLIRGIEKQLFPENTKKQLTEPEPGLGRETHIDPALPDLGPKTP